MLRSRSEENAFHGERRQPLGDPNGAGKSGGRVLLSTDEIYMHRLRAKRLQHWVLKVSLNGDVCVEGSLVDDGRCWHTSAIRQTLASDHVMTGSGSTYLLLGSMDLDTARGLHYPPKILSSFQRGFPPNWRELVDSLYGSVIRRQNQTSAARWDENIAGVHGFNTTAFRPPRNPPLAEAVEIYERRHGLNHPPPSPPPTSPPTRHRTPRIPPAPFPRDPCEEPRNTIPIVEMPPSDDEVSLSRQESSRPAEPAALVEKTSEQAEENEKTPVQPPLKPRTRSSKKAHSERKSKGPKTPVNPPPAKEAATAPPKDSNLLLKTPKQAEKKAPAPRSSSRLLAKKISEERDMMAQKDKEAKKATTAVEKAVDEGKKEAGPESHGEASKTAMMAEEISDPWSHMPPEGEEIEDDVEEEREEDEAREKENSPMKERREEMEEETDDFEGLDLRQCHLCLVYKHGEPKLIITGYVHGNPKPWTTGEIVRALGPQILETASGSLYRIIGSVINVDKSKRKGKVPEWLAESFGKGFPPNWKKLLRRLPPQLGRAAKPKAPKDPLQPSIIEASHFTDGTILQASRLENSLQPQQRPVDHSERPGRSENTPPFKVPKALKKAKKGGQKSGKPTKDSSDRRRSSSGRLLKAPLASWSGERIVYNAEGEAVSLALHTTATKATRNWTSSREGRDAVEALVEEMDLTVVPRVKQSEPSPGGLGRKSLGRRSRIPADEDDESDQEPKQVKKKRKLTKTRTSPLIPSSAKMKKVPAYRWTNDDTKRLQFALKCMRPGLESEEDWERVRQCFVGKGGGVEKLSPAQIREKAINTLGYDIRLQNEAEDEARKARAQEDQALAALSGKARRVNSSAQQAEALAFLNSLAKKDTSMDRSARPLCGTLPSLAQTVADSDLDDVMSPAEPDGPGRIERRFIPQPRRVTDLMGRRDEGASSSDDSPGPGRAEYIRSFRASNRSGNKGSLNSSAAINAAASKTATRKEMLAHAKDVEAQLRRARLAQLDEDEEEEEEEFSQDSD